MRTLPALTESNSLIFAPSVSASWMKAISLWRDASIHQPRAEFIVDVESDGSGVDRSQNTSCVEREFPAVLPDAVNTFDSATEFRIAVRIGEWLAPGACRAQPFGRRL